MGKAQYKKKTQAWRHNPMRVPDAHLGGGKAEGKADPGKEKQMLPILNKLKSPEYADRTWACAAVSNLIQNDPATRRLFQSRNVVGELIERLSDSVDEVVVEASGALRNLAIDGGHELCGEMYNKGVMTHLAALIGKISTTIDTIFAHSSPDAPPLSDADLQGRKHLLGLTENVLSLVWSLAETSHKTLQAVNGAGVEGLLVKVLHGREVLGMGVALASAQALYSLTQDNRPFKFALLGLSDALSTLVGVVQEEPDVAAGKGKGKKKQNLPDDDGRALLLRVLICGTLRNIVDPGSRQDEQVDIFALTNSIILPLINSLLDLQLDEVVRQVMASIEQPSAAAGKALKTDHKSPAEVALEKVERSLQTVVVGLEILTGICAGLEDADMEPEEGAEIEEGEGDDDEMDEDAGVDHDEDGDDDLPDEALIGMETDHSDVVQNGNSIMIDAPATLPHLLTTLRLPQRLTALSQPTPLSFPPSGSQASPHPPTTSALSVLHLRALEALNNLLLTTAASLPNDGAARSPVGGMIPAQGVWDGSFRLIEPLVAEREVLSQKGQEMRGEVLEMSIGCLWGLAKVASAQLSVPSNQLEGLMQIGPVLRNDVSRARVIELLGVLASRLNVSAEENKIISSTIIAQLSTPLAPEILVAIINAIIDIYADETTAYDPVFTSSGYLESLTGQVGRVKGEVKKVDKRKDRELRVRAEEAYENLVGFIKYRRTLGR